MLVSLAFGGLTPLNIIHSYLAGPDKPEGIDPTDLQVYRDRPAFISKRWIANPGVLGVTVYGSGCTIYRQSRTLNPQS